MRRAMLAVCVLVAAAGCLKINIPTEPTAPLGAPFDLKAGATAVVPGGLIIRFDTVRSDSRCPIDAVCIQMGEAVIAMTLDEPISHGEQHEWRTNPAGFEVAYSRYVIKLIELRPYPSAGVPIPPADYVATLRVAER